MLFGDQVASAEVGRHTGQSGVLRLWWTAGEVDRCSQLHVRTRVLIAVMLCSGQAWQEEKGAGSSWEEEEEGEDVRSPPPAAAAMRRASVELSEARKTLEDRDSEVSTWWLAEGGGAA